MSSFDPLEDAAFMARAEGYAANYAHKHGWKLDGTHEWDDMMQEAKCVLLKLRNHYAGKIVEPKHFMALYKTALARRFIDLAAANTAQASHEVAAEADGSRENMGDVDNDGYLGVMLRQAPSEVLSVVNLFLNCPQELLDMALTGWREGRGSRTICRLLGIDERRDVMQETMNYFSEH